MKNLACAAIVGMAVGLGALSVGGGGAASLASLAAVRLPMVVAYLPHISPISPPYLPGALPGAAAHRHDPISPLYLAHISPISRPYLAHISPISPQVRRPMAVVVGLISHREMIMDIKV